MVNHKYLYVGRWCGPNGIATAELIAPEWIITAPHVVNNKIENPENVNITVCFGNEGKEASAGVEKAFLRYWERGQAWQAWKERNHEWEEVALAKLDRPIKAIPPVEVAENLIPPCATIRVNIVGTTIRDEPVFGARCAQEWSKDRRYLRRKDGYADGRCKHANKDDSGGAWLIEQESGSDVLVGIAQGRVHERDPSSGAATPPALCREWIDEILKKFAAEAKWVPVVYR